MDLDRCLFVAHNKDDDSFLIWETKEFGEEKLTGGELMALRALAKLPKVTVWVLRRTDEEDSVEWGQVGVSKKTVEVSIEEVQRRFSDWWHKRKRPASTLDDL